MPNKRLPMRPLREILRLRLNAQLSLRQIKNSLKLSLGVIQKVCRKAAELELNWESVKPLDDRQLTQLFYPSPLTTSLFKQYGIELNRKTMSAWIIRCSKSLIPIYDRLKTIQLQQKVINADETPVKPKAHQTVTCGSIAVVLIYLRKISLRRIVISSVMLNNRAC